MLSLSHSTHPHFPKANSACSPKFAHFFSGHSTPSEWDAEKLKPAFSEISVMQISAWRAAAVPAVAQLPKFSLWADFNIFDLEKSSFPGEMNLLVEFLWAESTLPHKKTWMWFSLSFIDYENYRCRVAFVLKEQFQKCFQFASVHKFLAKHTAKLGDHLKLLDFIRILTLGFEIFFPSPFASKKGKALR